ncbi:MAG TPA: GAF domain-containing protein [Polyangiaceae bacterium]|jgi:two-component system sensor histidine kinase/response regulator|nr:GAF domain-containing protein [Polyangiaceae bacterium]
MGARCQRYFEEANKLGGLVAKMRLASLAQITSMEASTAADSAELFVRLEGALERVRSEFAGEGAAAAPVKAAAPALKPALASSEQLRRYLSVAAELFSQRSLFTGDLEATVRRITEAACSTLDIERVSVWFLDDERTKIVCADLFQRTSAVHSSGVELYEKDFAPYFEALASKHSILAADANRDPRTRCFSESYLQPLGIGAMLDVPIWASEEMVGVICHEHVGGVRNWTPDEEAFGHILSGLVSVTVEQRALVRGSSG